MSILHEAQQLMDEMASAYRRGDAAGCAALFSADAVLMSPYAIVTEGRGAIEALHREWARDGGNGKRISVVAAGGGGNLAWCVSHYSEGEVTEAGNSLSVLVRDDDGGWVIRACSLNRDDPPLAGA